MRISTSTIDATAALTAGARVRPPTHPGDVIGGVLDEQHVSVRKAAEAMGVAHTTLQNIILRKSVVTAEMAMRIGAYLGNGPALWLNMQQDYDLWQAEQAIGEQVRKIVKLEAR
jgi:antitoxin HigA-1